MTPKALSSLLAKVQDLAWVLEECRTRVADTKEGMEALLQFGLRRTEPTNFSSSHSFIGAAISSHHISSSIPPASPIGLLFSSAEQGDPMALRFLWYRLIFLRYVDRLHSLAAMGGSLVSPQWSSAVGHERPSMVLMRSVSGQQQSNREVLVSQPPSARSSTAASAPIESGSAGDASYSAARYALFRDCDLLQAGL